MINEQLAQKYVLGLSALVFVLLLLFIGLARNNASPNLPMEQHIDLLQYALEKIESAQAKPAQQLQSLNSVHIHYPLLHDVDPQNPLIKRAQTSCLHFFLQLNAQPRPLVAEKKQILIRCAQVLETTGQWHDLEDANYEAFKFHTSTYRLPVMTPIIVLLFILLIIPLLLLSHFRMRLGRAPVDPKAETLVNVDPIDIDTQAITIDDGQHTTTTHGQTTAMRSDPVGHY